MSTDDFKIASGKRIEIFGEFFEKYEDEESRRQIAEIIEKQLQSNVAELYRNRIISKILDDKTIYDEVAHVNCRYEIIKLTQFLTFDQIKIYLYMRMNIEKDKTVWLLIEDFFKSNLKYLLINREMEKSQRKIRYWNKQIREEWHDLKTMISEEDLLTYALVTLTEERSRK